MTGIQALIDAWHVAACVRSEAERAYRLALPGARHGARNDARQVFCAAAHSVECAAERESAAHVAIWDTMRATGASEEAVRWVYCESIRVRRQTATYCGGRPSACTQEEIRS